MATRTRAAAAGAYVALLRGINVGTANRMPMPPLLAAFSDAGCSDVQSYIMSGNIVFHAPAALARRIPTLIAAAIDERLGCTVPVVVRSAAELAEVARANPFLVAGAEPKSLHVLFLADQPSAARAAALDPERSPTDRFAVRGREVYLCCPNGIGRSKLTNDFFDRGLATVGTMRNWNTVLKLLAMTGAG
jgi:uncharacterized protein (DUF1697 family)